MEELPNTTEEKIALIAHEALESEGVLNFERVSQLLSATFAARDYLDVLGNYPNPQEYIDGLYKVNHPYFVTCSFTYLPDL